MFTFLDGSTMCQTNQPANTALRGQEKPISLNENRYRDIYIGRMGRLQGDNGAEQVWKNKRRSDEIKMTCFWRDCLVCECLSVKCHEGVYRREKKGEKKA